MLLESRRPAEQPSAKRLSTVPDPAPAPAQSTERAGFLDLILRATQDGIVNWDLVGNHEQYNPRFSNLFGFDDEDLRDRPVNWRELIHPDDAAEAELLIQDHLVQDWPFVTTLRMRHRHGGYRTILCRGAAQKDATGRPARMVIIFSDISDRIQLEERLAQAQKLGAIGQLAAGVAHEINTPMQYIGDNLHFAREAISDLLAFTGRLKGFVQAAATAAGTTSVLDELSAAESAADVPYLSRELPLAIERSLEGVSRMTTIVRALKTFAHPAGREFSAVDLKSLLEATAAVSTSEWKYVAELSVDVEAGLPAVHCAGGELSQVVLNLIVNAAHAIADQLGPCESKGSITVSARRVGDNVEIAVKDTGTGIPEHARAQVFEPFFTTKEVGKGTGQGLALARACIVNRHHGSLEFETEVGQGTTFVVTIPIAAAPQADG